jgi:transposase
MEKQVNNFEKMPIVHPQAAGIDVGSSSHYVCIGQGEGQVKVFGVYTDELHSLCRWLQAHQIATVALESTGSYWPSLFVLLQDYGLNPILVNGKFTKNVRGRKTDVLDCQWIQRLHSLGLLEGSFLPDLFTEKLRAYCRHRGSLLEDAAGYISKMQKALRLINIRLDIALRDIMGLSGRAIIEAILSGERNPAKLADLVHKNVHKSKQEIAQALTGDWREEYLFELKQCYDLYLYFHQKIQQCDIEIEKMLLTQVQDKEQTQSTPRLAYEGKEKKLNKNDPKINLQALCFQLTGGIDLSCIEGVGRNLLLTLVSEVGMELSAFPTAGHFTSWLRLAPNRKISGGKLLSSKTNQGKNRLADALRHTALVIGNNLKQGSLHQFFKRIAYKKGQSVAITATARKVAVIIWNMLTQKKPYLPMIQTDYLEKIRKSQIKNLQKKVNQLKIKPEELIFVSP